MPVCPLWFKSTKIKISMLYGPQVRNRSNLNRRGTRPISSTSTAPAAALVRSVRTHLRALTAVTAAALACGTLAQERIVVDLPLPPPSAMRAGLPADPVPTDPPAPAVDAVQTEDAAAAPTPAPQASQLLVSLQPGESLYHVFARHQLAQADLVGMAADRRIRARLRRLQSGQRLSVHVSPSGKIQRVYLQTPGPRDQLIERGDDGFKLRDVPDAAEFISAPIVTSAALTPQIDAPSGGPEPAERPADSLNAAALATARPTLDAADAQAREPTSQVASPDPESQPDHDDSDVAVHSVTVRPGDSLYAIFKRAGVPPQDLARVLEAGVEAQRLRRLRPGQEVTLSVSAQGLLHDLALAVDESKTLRATRTGENFTVKLELEPLERRTASASAMIEDSLFLAGQREGLSDRLIMELVEIFGWDVDFALDVRSGDRFTVLFEELYKDGVKVGDGHILAAEFVNQGRTVRAVRFVDATGGAEYFSPEGLSMRKAFLRTPVTFSRISSKFSIGRMHPVLQRMRAHKGVDYAAPTGTPVRAAGNGRVEFADWKGGYGRTVIVQHGSTYTTLYAHLSRLHPGVRTGGRVQQGAIVGYVGQTGLATGPHLHYEFRVHGVHQDPLRVKLPKALPIEARFKRDFLRDSAPLVAQLDRLARTRVATRD